MLVKEAKAKAKARSTPIQEVDYKSGAAWVNAASANARVTLHVSFVFGFCFFLKTAPLQARRGMGIEQNRKFESTVRVRQQTGTRVARMLQPQSYRSLLDHEMWGKGFPTEGPSRSAFKPNGFGHFSK